MLRCGHEEVGAGLVPQLGSFALKTAAASGDSIIVDLGGQPSASRTHSFLSKRIMFSIVRELSPQLCGCGANTPYCRRLRDCGFMVGDRRSVKVWLLAQPLLLAAMGPVLRGRPTFASSVRTRMTKEDQFG